jgi:hypothetical protein
MGKSDYREILVKRLVRMPLGLVWLVTVVAVWIVATALIAVLIKAAFDGGSAGALIGQSMLSAAFASGVVGGPATAVALRIRRNCGLGKAALGGLGMAVLIMLFLWSYLEASGTSVTDAWSAVPPILIVAVVEIGLAFTLRGRRVMATSPAPGAD